VVGTRPEPSFARNLIFGPIVVTIIVPIIVTDNDRDKDDDEDDRWAMPQPNWKPR
jgi:hypothetical protein